MNCSFHRHHGLVVLATVNDLMPKTQIKRMSQRFVAVSSLSAPAGALQGRQGIEVSRTIGSICPMPSAAIGITAFVTERMEYIE